MNASNSISTLSEGTAGLSSFDRTGRRGRFARLATAAVAVALVAGGFAAVAPAQAATAGPGYGSYAAGNFKGAQMIDGVPTWCYQPGVALPTGASADQGIVGSLASFDATTLAQLRYATAVGAASMASPRAGTNANEWAAATGFVVQYIADPAGMVSDGGNPGSTFDSAIRWQGTVIGADTATVRALGEELLTASQAITPTGSLAPTIEVTMDPLHNFAGAVTISDVPAGTSTTFTLVNAIFLTTGTATATVTDAATAAFVGVPPAGGADYKVSGTYASSVEGNLPQVHSYTTGRQQATLSAAGVPSTLTAGGPFADPLARALPGITSKAQTLTSPGADSSETVTVTGLPATFPAGGIDVTSSAYLEQGAEPSSSDVITDLNKVYTTEVWNTAVAGEHTFTLPVVAIETPSGTHLRWIHTATNHDTGAVFAVGATDDPNEWTAVTALKVQTTPPTGVVAGTSVQDTVYVDGYVADKTTIVVTQYQVPTGQTLTCTAETQIGAPLAPILVTAGVNDHVKYMTVFTGPQVAGSAGFVEQTFVDGILTHTAGCLEEPFTVTAHLPTVAG